MAKHLVMYSFSKRNESFSQILNVIIISIIIIRAETNANFRLTNVLYTNEQMRKRSYYLVISSIH